MICNRPVATMVRINKKACYILTKTRVRIPIALVNTNKNNKC